MQISAHHRYRSRFIISGAVCGGILSLRSPREGNILGDAMTLYLPAAVMVAQILSLLLHLVFPGWHRPVDVALTKGRQSTATTFGIEETRDCSSGIWLEEGLLDSQLLLEHVEKMTLNQSKLLCKLNLSGSVKIWQRTATRIASRPLVSTRT
jgi:hypothetical protein